MKSNKWKNFEAHLRSLNLKYTRTFAADLGCTAQRFTIEFWVVSPGYNHKCVHVFFTARHPKYATIEQFRRSRRTSFSVLALVDGKRTDLRSAYFQTRHMVAR